MHKAIGVLLALLMAAAAVGPAWGQAAPPEKKKEKQSAVITSDPAGKDVLSSSALIKQINTILDGKYEDLEIVVSACHSGEFTSRAAGANGLKGQWSVSTSTSTTATCQDLRTEEEEKNGKSGFKVGDNYYHGYMAQYAKKLAADKNTVGNKVLHQTARDNDHFDKTDAQYASSDEAADKMTVHGGSKSNHAIVFAAHGSKRGLSDALYFTLIEAGYTDETINYLRGLGGGKLSDGTTSPDGAATKEGLDKAIKDLRTELDKNPGMEKAYFFFSSHGAYKDLTVAVNTTDTGLPESGLVITASSAPVDLFADSPELLASLMEELPKNGGGLWADDPFLRREGNSYITFTTVEEQFLGDTTVELFLNGLSLGLLEMGNEFGADYFVEIPDPTLDALMPDILADGTVSLGFSLPGLDDLLRLAVEADWASPANPHLLEYGLGIGAIVGGTVPEPATALVLIGPVAFLALRRRLYRPA